MAHPPPQPPSTPKVIVTGASRSFFRDFYHRFLRVRWSVALLAIVLFFLALNTLFALAYFMAGGIANTRPGSFADAFYFSVQTMGTIGYGSMYPTTDLTNVLVVCESVVGMLVIAIVTGLIFSKFSVSSARIVFSRSITIAPWDGVPTMTFRVSNERGNQIIEAQLRVVLVRTEKTREGFTFYRMVDLPLTRDRSPALNRSWSVMHTIEPGGLLYGHTPESLKQIEAEIMVSLIGVDDTTLQPVHARHTYTDDQIIWGARPVDVLTIHDDGRFEIDMNKFHEVVATEPTETFPYPRPKAEPVAEEQSIQKVA